MRISRCLPLLLTAAAAPALATTYVPNTTQDQFGEDSTRCALREAIQAARTNAAFGGCPAGTLADIIDLGAFASPYRITRAGAGEDDNATGDFDLSGDGAIILQGNGAGKTVISGEGLDRIIDVASHSAVDVYLLDLTLRGGDAGGQSGGAVRARGDVMIIQRVHITASAASSGGGLYVAANADEVTVRDSAITRNRASSGGGGVLNHAGVQLRLINSTLSENVAENGDGGGLLSWAPVSLKSVTIAFNSADSHGGAYFRDGTASFDNSIFANNRQRFGLFGADNLSCAITANSLGYNLYMDRDCDFVTAPASDVQADPRLGTLVDAGHGVPVNLLLPDSPAVDTGAPPPNDGTGPRCLAQDQRRFDRDRCDRGAYEERYTYSVSETFDAADSNPGNGVCASTLGGCTLRAALQEAAVSDQPVIIEVRPGRYDVNIPGRDENLAATGDLDLIGPGNSARVLVGHGADVSIVRGNGSDRIFDTGNSSANTAPVGLFGLRITGGATQATAGDNGDGGGMRLRPFGDSTIDQVWFDRNHGVRQGGGLHYLDASTAVGRVTRSAFTRNSAAEDGGGAYFAQGDPLHVGHSLFADNLAGDAAGGLRFSNSNRVELAYSTITGNRAGSHGGGLVPDSDVVLTAIAADGNFDTGGYPDCHTQVGVTVLSSGYNLIGDGGPSGCAMAGDLTGNQVGIDVRLPVVSVQDRRTPFAAPHPGSPALDAVPRWRCQSADGLLQSLDQHDRPRPGDDPAPSACTAGAIEAPSDLIFASSIDDSYAGE